MKKYSIDKKKEIIDVLQKFLKEVNTNVKACIDDNEGVAFNI